MEFNSISWPFACEGIEFDENSMLRVFTSFSHTTFVVFYRMQAQAAELNEKIETVNRERKYHQVTFI